MSLSDDIECIDRAAKTTHLHPDSRPAWQRLRARLADYFAKEAECERLSKLVYVPGSWNCAKCKFTLQQMNLNALDGTVTANDKPGEKCPNCDSPLWRSTWQDDAIELSKRCEEQVLRAIAAERERDELNLKTVQAGAMTHRHIKRGNLHREIARGHLQTAVPIGDGTALVLYVSEEGRHWARPVTEFDDGRFECLAISPPEEYIPVSGVAPEGAAQCPLHGPANITGVATGSRNGPARESDRIASATPPDQPSDSAKDHLVRRYMPSDKLVFGLHPMTVTPGGLYVAHSDYAIMEAERDQAVGLLHAKEQSEGDDARSAKEECARLREQLASQTTDLANSRDQYRHDAEALLVINRAAQDALVAAEAERDAARDERARLQTLLNGHRDALIEQWQGLNAMLTADVDRLEHERAEWRRKADAWESAARIELSPGRYATLQCAVDQYPSSPSPTRQSPPADEIDLDGCEPWQYPLGGNAEMHRARQKNAPPPGADPQDALDARRCDGVHPYVRARTLLTALWQHYDAGGESMGRGHKAVLLEAAMALLDPFRDRADVERLRADYGDLVNRTRAYLSAQMAAAEGLTVAAAMAKNGAP